MLSVGPLHVMLNFSQTLPHTNGDAPMSRGRKGQQIASKARQPWSAGGLCSKLHVQHSGPQQKCAVHGVPFMMLQAVHHR
jgi:hypothetical protein